MEHCGHPGIITFINVQSHMGQSTRKEIGYARLAGITVEYRESL
ncbi:hypothetical protein [Paenibacillus riograndensis]|nr:hypothetical protein [Paenibacillus riograndensis]